MKRLNKKGFTLAELLIVVAIIAVLVAIAIPIFTSQLEKSRDAVTLSNIRAAYAQAQSSYLTQDETSTDATYALGKDGKTATVTVTGVVAKGHSGEIDGFDQLPFADQAADLKTKDKMGGTAGTYELTFTYDENGNLTHVDAKIQDQKQDKN